MRPVGFFVEHPLGALTHSAPATVITHECPKCDAQFSGEVRKVLGTYREHVLDTHMGVLEDCGCCGAFHFPEFDGDCREDWERF